MLSSTQADKIRAEARPYIKRQMDDAKIIAGFRDMVTAAGGDWSALKAVIKAELQDEEDDAGDAKKVGKLSDKAEWTRIYLDMFGHGVGNLNEFNSSSEPDHDPETGEITEPAAPANHPAKPTEAQAKHAVEDALLSASEGVHDPVSTPSPNPSTAVDLDGGSENAPATVDTLHPQPASLAGLPGATAPGERIQPETRRVMSMTPLEPRTAGGLKGFGFTVSFDERPVVAGGVQVPFEGAINQ